MMSVDMYFLGIWVWTWCLCDEKFGSILGSMMCFRHWHLHWHWHSFFGYRGEKLLNMGRAEGEEERTQTDTLLGCFFEAVCYDLTGKLECMHCFAIIFSDI